MIAYEDGHLGQILVTIDNTTFKLCPKQIVCKYKFKCVGKSHNKQLSMGCEYTHVGKPHNLSIPNLSHFEKCEKCDKGRLPHFKTFWPHFSMPRGPRTKMH